MSGVNSQCLPVRDSSDTWRIEAELPLQPGVIPASREDICTDQYIKVVRPTLLKLRFKGSSREDFSARLEFYPDVEGHEQSGRGRLGYKTIQSIDIDQDSVTLWHRLHVCGMFHSSLKPQRSEVRGSDPHFLPRVGASFARRGLGQALGAGFVTLRVEGTVPATAVMDSACTLAMKASIHALGTTEVAVTLENCRMTVAGAHFTAKGRTRFAVSPDAGDGGIAEEDRVPPVYVRRYVSVPQPAALGNQHLSLQEIIIQPPQATLVSVTTEDLELAVEPTSSPVTWPLDVPFPATILYTAGTQDTLSLRATLVWPVHSLARLRPSKADVRIRFSLSGSASSLSPLPPQGRAAVRLQSFAGELILGHAPAVAWGDAGHKSSVRVAVDALHLQASLASFVVAEAWEATGTLSLRSDSSRADAHLLVAAGPGALLALESLELPLIAGLGDQPLVFEHRGRSWRIDHGEACATVAFTRGADWTAQIYGGEGSVSQTPHGDGRLAFCSLTCSMRQPSQVAVGWKFTSVGARLQKIQGRTTWVLDVSQPACPTSLLAVELGAWAPFAAQLYCDLTLEARPPHTAGSSSALTAMVSRLHARGLTCSRLGGGGEAAATYDVTGQDTACPQLLVDGALELDTDGVRFLPGSLRLQALRAAQTGGSVSLTAISTAMTGGTLEALTATVSLALAPTSGRSEGARWTLKHGSFAVLEGRGTLPPLSGSAAGLVADGMLSSATGSIGWAARGGNAAAAMLFEVAGGAQAQGAWSLRGSSQGEMELRAIQPEALSVRTGHFRHSLLRGEAGLRWDDATFFWSPASPLGLEVTVLAKWRARLRTTYIGAAEAGAAALSAAQFAISEPQVRRQRERSGRLGHVLA